MHHAEIQGHYDHFARREVILSTLREAGKNVERLTPGDLAPFDQLHTSGRTASESLIELLAPQPAHHVLDVGCGIGGPARMLNQAAGCRVTGIDLTPSFISTAHELTRRTAQSAQMSYAVGSATALPFAEVSFDAAWHIHMSMNVADKTAMYAGIFRVLKPGARFIIYDPVRGQGPEPAYPAPWAETARTSFLLSEREMLAAITQAGFVVTQTSDATNAGLAWFAERQRIAAAAGIKPDARLAAMTGNHQRNLDRGAVRILCAVFQRP